MALISIYLEASRAFSSTSNNRLLIQNVSEVSMEKNAHQLRKIIEKERRHKAWLECNLKKSKQLRESKKQILKLQTQLAYTKQRTETDT